MSPRHAGVGLAAVARALNGSPSVSERTRERVLAVMRELDYRPRPAAQQLAGGRTQTIGLLMSFFGNPSAIKRLRRLMLALPLAGCGFALADVEISWPGESRPSGR